MATFDSRTPSGEIVSIDIAAPGVKPEDINHDVATRAYGGLSWSPERSADREIRDYIRVMNGIWDEFSTRAQTEDQREIALAEFEKFRERYVQGKTELLQRQSGLVSSMIAGPSKFPFRQQEKKRDALQKREGAFLQSIEKAKNRALENIRPRTPRSISADLPDAASQLQTKIDKAKKLQETMKAANAVVRSRVADEQKVKRLQEEVGLSESQSRELLKPDFAGRLGFPQYALTNNLANIKRMEGRITQISRERAMPESDATIFTGGSIEENREINRLQIIFNEKPDVDTRNQLKRNGFRFSPREGAWQRQLTDNAREAAKRIIGSHVQEESPPLVAEATIKQVEETLEETPTLQDLKLSEIRRINNYLRLLNEARAPGARNAAAKIKEAQEVLETIPGGLLTVNLLQEKLESKRQLRVRPEKREAFKRAEKAIAELQRPQPVSLSQAQERFDSRSDRRKALDGARTAQNIAPAEADTDKERRLQQRWLKNPSRLDFQGVDTKRANPPLKPRMRRSKKL